MQHGETWLRTGDGYTHPGRSVKILAENVFYNKDYKAYRVLLTDSALEGPQKRVTYTQQPPASTSAAVAG